MASSTSYYHQNHPNHHSSHRDVPSPTAGAIAPSDEGEAALAFRRADGSRREFFFDDSIRSLPQPVASLFLLNRSPPATLPRNVLRPFRRDNDEPASPICLVRETWQAVCRDGRDRSRCSVCRSKVTKTAASETASTASQHYRWSMMSPQRVFRDVVMRDVAEPLRPELRDALLQAFNATIEATQEPPTRQTRQTKAQKPRPRSPTQHRLQRFSQLSISRPSLPSPPPSPTRLPGEKKQAVAFPSESGSTLTPPPLTEFRYFPFLPYEIRRMVWEQALPTRVLLRDDLGPSTYRGVWRVFRPASHTHSIEMLWRSDLFYVCAEARRVVEAYRDGSRKGGDNYENKTSEAQTAPFLRYTTNRTRLQASLDVLYYPWLGSASLRRHGGGGIWTSGWHYNHDARQGTQQGNNESTRPPWVSKMDAGYAMRSGTSPEVATLASAPIPAVPYGCWASQLRILCLPITTVALDAAWIDRGHPDTIAWAAGVDLSEPEADEKEGEGDGDGESESEPISPPTSLQVVVADIVVPVRIRLDHDALTPGQRRLLRQHITPQLWADTCHYRREMDGPTEASLMPGPSSSSSSSFSSASSLSLSSTIAPPKPPLTNLNGMDFTVLVDLYDDGRIEELLSLQTASNQTQLPPNTERPIVLNKSALHRCIACTRQAWEARSSKTWADKFGPLLGAHLEKLCRPTIVFSVVLAFDGGDRNDED
ncbi:hypothetical protein SCUCBS95973_001053 [Sporothrix curviconia]|uniref:2EXR domain-containing protein n=1 Tax=Sporothrix curviconia TaxID=1260050 RepID=A0ABP0AVD6_9PEZI